MLYSMEMINTMWSFIQNKLGASKAQFIIGILALLVICAALIWILARTHAAGFEAGRTSVQERWNHERAELSERNAALAQQVATLQRVVDTQASDFERKSNEATMQLIADYERRMAAVGSHAQRVYIPVKTPVSAKCSGPGDDTASTASPDGDTRAELDPEVVAALASIARDGDRCFIERNELIQRYNAARAALMQLEQQNSIPVL